MNQPYGLIADVHLHGWSAFSSTMPDGKNSRLHGLLEEIFRAGVTTKAAGGNRLVVAGDLFHVRGSVAPSVLNPTLDYFKELVDRGLEVIIIPGNHDLEGKHCERLGSAVTALEGVGCTVIHETTVIDNLVLVPWFDSVAALKEKLQRNTLPTRPAEMDLILHAPINGVIMGIPDHGLEPEWLDSLGFHRVFAGHYHNHKAFCDDTVFSVGALAHHTWSDIGSRAGFCIVHDDRVEQLPSMLPKFVDLGDGKIEDTLAQAKGNFVRAKLNSTKIADLAAVRELLEKAGALGVQVISVKKPTEARDGSLAASVQAGASVEQSVSEFIRGKSYTRPEAVSLRAAKVLAQAEVA
jgi:DNA repair exonuclease SbcCD nuclease subunit